MGAGCQLRGEFFGSQIAQKAVSGAVARHPPELFLDVAQGAADITSIGKREADGECGGEPAYCA